MLATRLAPMPFELATARLELGLWQEADAGWYQGLVAERGDRPPTIEEAGAKVLELRDDMLMTGIGILPIRRWQEGDSIGYAGLTIGRTTLEEPELVVELLRGVHGQGTARKRHPS